MIQILGALDLLAAGLLTGTAYKLALPHGLIIGIAAYLLLKSLIFLMDIGSFFDLVGGVLLILSLFRTLPPIVFFIAAGLVGLKGIMSMFVV